MRWLWPWLAVTWWCAALPAHADEADHQALTRLAMEHHGSHQHDEAIQRGEEALAAAKRQLGADHERVADMHYNLAGFLAARGRWAEAEQHYQASLPLYAKHRGERHAYIAQVHSRLAEAHANLYDYDASLAAAERALAMMEALNAPPAEIYDYLIRVAEAYSVANRADEAAKRYLRAVALGERLWGRNSPHLVAATMMAGKAFHEAEDYATALIWHRRALSRVERHIGERSKEAVSVSNNIAAALHQLGRLNEALPVFERAASLSRTLWGDVHPETAIVELNRVHLLQKLGRLDEAERIAREAAPVLEAVRDPGQRSFAYTTLADVLLARGMHDEAMALLDKSLAEIEAFYGSSHPHVAKALLRLADGYVTRSEQRADAVAAVRRAREILIAHHGPRHLTVAYADTALGKLIHGADAVVAFEEALSIQREAFGDAHPLMADGHANLALEHAGLAQWSEALGHQQKCNAIREATLKVALEVSSEQQRATVMQTFAKEVDETLSIHLHGMPQDRAATEEAMLTLLRRKGRVVDATADALKALRRRASPPDKRLLDELSDVRRQLAALVIATLAPTAADTAAAHISLMQRRAQEIEEELGRRMRGVTSEAPVSMAALDAALDEDAAYLDFVLFQPVRFDLAERARCGPLHYAVYLKRKGVAPRGVDLGPAIALEADLRAFRTALASPAADPKPAAARLYRALIAPIEPWLGDATRLFVSPDGALNLIPFAALVDARGRHAIERWVFRYLSSGRDLVRPRAGEPPRQNNVVIGAPAFGEGSDQALYFAPLPGAEDEALSLSKLLARSTLLMGEDANEAALAELRGPAVLHVATHGFFLSPSATGVGFPCTRSASLVDVKLPEHERHPLLMSGLAFAGANAGARDRQDGVLTALEASSLDLAGTQLVVLSACETGVGDVRNGDGVHGLRRAFEIAGAETQVMSLWKVDDQATRQLMLRYYESLRNGAGRVAAMRDVQLEMLADPATRHPFYWAGFIVSGDDGPLAGEQLFAPPAQAPASRGCACELGASSKRRAPWLGWMLALWVLARRRVSDR